MYAYMTGIRDKITLFIAQLLYQRDMKLSRIPKFNHNLYGKNRLIGIRDKCLLRNRYTPLSAKLHIYCDLSSAGVCWQLKLNHNI